jgi:hypothetical protein
MEYFFGFVKSFIDQAQVLMRCELDAAYFHLLGDKQQNGTTKCFLMKEMTFPEKKNVPLSVKQHYWKVNTTPGLVNIVYDW